MVGKEKGYTFALAFDRKAEYIETDEKIEIACVRPATRWWVGHEDESKR